MLDSDQCSSFTTSSFAIVCEVIWVIYDAAIEVRPIMNIRSTSAKLSVGCTEVNEHAVIDAKQYVCCVVWAYISLTIFVSYTFLFPVT